MKLHHMAHQLEIGRQPLHIATSIGSTEAVIKLIENGTNVNCTDENGDTPLHIGVLSGNENVVALLVANGANLEFKNKEGHTALYMALMNKNPTMVEILLRFGIDPCVTEWDWSGRGHDGPKESQILEEFDKHCQLIPGFKNGLVAKELFYVKQDKQCSSEQLQIEVDTSCISKPFVLQCYKFKSEYVDVKRHLNSSEHYLSDMYECRTWGCTDKEIQIRLIFNTKILPNRKPKFIAVDNCVGRLDESYKLTDDDERIQGTILKTFLDIKNGVYLKFMIVSEVKSEVFKTSRASLTLKPEIMPSLEISIPENAFVENSSLSIKILDTTDEEEEEYKSFSHLVMFSSCSIPRKEVSITIPTLIDIDNCDVVVLASKNEHPDSIGEWEKIEPMCTTNSVSFQSKQLNMLVVMPRSLILTESGLSEIQSFLYMIIKESRKVTILIFIKQLPDTCGEISVVVNCVLCSKQQTTRDNWIRNGYYLLGLSHSLVCKINSVFQITLSGNIEEVYHTRKMELEFHIHRDNFRVFNICVKNREMKAEGDIRIQQTTSKSNGIEIVGEENGGCMACGTSRPVTREMDNIATILSCRVSFDQTEKNLSLSRIFDGFRLVRGRRRHKVSPVV